MFAIVCLCTAWFVSGLARFTRIAAQYNLMKYNESNKIKFRLIEPIFIYVAVSILFIMQFNDDLKQNIKKTNAG